MTMCSYKKILVTASKLAAIPLPEQIRKVAKLHRIDMLILREKELTEKEYEALALEVLKACKEEGITCVLHSFVRVAEKLGVKKIHLPLARLREEQQNLSFFDTIGVSVHSSQEAKEAYRLGATYLTAGHVFETDCKKGLPGRGLEFLEEICQAVPIPVYGIGGIDDDNTEQVKKAGAAGECRMSYYMR